MSGTEGRFECVPIPESGPTRSDADVPTYGGLDLPTDASRIADTSVHLDPTFAGVHGSAAYTCGDPQT
ncbi:Nmad3 family putative nucleotide modification protein [Natronomonas moolapensis]|uniref:Nmad3 family putative nucleotide modification protein n=1 Tax=Natronomonas moolapensis TaxID=416273 RepID=UPI00373AE6F7